jgi:CrcB protein
LQTLRKNIVSIYGLLLVGAGAALGAMLRWCLGLSLNSLIPNLPLGTLCANLIGGFLMGVAIGVFANNATFSSETRLFITTGFLGGLTTFSTFSAESVDLLSRGELGWACLHLASHVSLSFFMTVLGLYSVQLFRA